MALIDALQNPDIYPHPVSGVTLIETHISWVLLTGDYAYKLKKPVDLGFLDFSTLERRRHFCEQELRLNRRLAPQLYLEVVAIGGSSAAPRLAGPNAPLDGPPIEYAVKMRQFDPQAQLDRLLERGELTGAHMDRLAAVVADFHGRIAPAGPDRPFGSPEAVHAPVRENFEHLRRADACMGERAELAGLDALERWSEASFTRLGSTFAARRSGGFVRECHGDMHLRNMVLIDGEVVVFDCIEFNDNLRWIDVMSEVAFVDMDLRDRGRPDLAQRFLNAYLESTGDYAGLALLPYYRVYRALVRAKVAAIRLTQHDLDRDETQAVQAECRSYIELARSFTASRPPLLIITHGLSGSGKTTYTQQLLEATQAIRIRSDVGRKRLFAVAREDHRAREIDVGLYGREASERTYERLAEMAKGLLEGGYDVIVDAAFLKQAQRAHFRALAERSGVGFAILACEAPPTLLRERLRQRERAGRDASDAGLAVLEHQLKTADTLDAQERAEALSLDPARGMDIAAVANALEARRPTPN
ncbi:MAG TPA: AAA family ATPase [Gammaproteobacteria bacterium]|nr:AAA family ATPase [Gammaproteobacteria bacterium]